MVRKKKPLTVATVVALALAALALLAAAASGLVIKGGILVISLDGELQPKTLTKSKLTPIHFNFNGSIKTASGSPPPPATTLTFDFDKNGVIDTKGLPVCPKSRIEASPTAAARKACKDSLVGTGVGTAEVTFPEQAPFMASGPILIFNGGTKGAKTVFLLHIYAHVPAPTTFIVPAVITKESKGKFGTHVVVKVPKIAGGFGAVAKFSVTVHRTWTYHGEKRSLLSARCPAGALFAYGEFHFIDGTDLSGTIVKPCQGRG